MPIVITIITQHTNKNYCDFSLYNKYVVHALSLIMKGVLREFAFYLELDL